ncbi:MAG TPA: ATP-binding protein, partial [Nitrososphaeraceae archaeon]|nr:ATP-binding protein [Nitrososphaeraceae archaeon]
MKGTSLSVSSQPDFGKYDTLIKYTLVPSIPLSIIAILCINPNTWVLSEIHHFYIELFAVLLAAILSFYYIARARTLSDKFSLFIGIGFLANALIDLLHVVISFTYMNEFMFLKYFIPQTWFAGRIFLGAMFVIAIAGYPLLSGITRKPNRINLARQPSDKQGQLQSTADFSIQDQQSNLVEERLEKIPRILVWSLVLLTIAAGGLAIGSLFVVFPGSVLDEFPIHRPYEIPPLALFVIALLYFYKNELYKKSDVFYKGVLAAIVIDIFGQIIMSYSTTSFDTAHNTAHVLKDAAYFVNIIGLALSSISYNAKLKEANKNLIEREEVIRSQYEKLKESDRMKDEFVNIAAHELRTPIQPILGLSEIIRPKVNATDREYVDVIVRNAKRLHRLTEEILDVTKIESQSLKLKKEEVNLKDVIETCINDEIVNKHSNNNDDEKKPKILYQPKDILLRADRIRISQVISNLLSNAIKFSPGGTISIVSDLKSTDRDKNPTKDEAIISIKDDGNGIDEEILPKLFSKFATKSFSGTGLGLFICKSIIEAHGGNIWAENNSNGRGATFSFTLP